MIGYVEIMEISASVLGLLLLVGLFVCIRKRYVQNKKKKPVCVQDSNGLVHFRCCILFYFLCAYSHGTSRTCHQILL